MAGGQQRSSVEGSDHEGSGMDGWAMTDVGQIHPAAAVHPISINPAFPSPNNKTFLISDLYYTLSAWFAADYIPRFFHHNHNVFLSRSIEGHRHRESPFFASSELPRHPATGPGHPAAPAAAVFWRRPQLHERDVFSSRRRNAAGHGLVVNGARGNCNFPRRSCLLTCIFPPEQVVVCDSGMSHHVTPPSPSKITIS